MFGKVCSAVTKRKMEDNYNYAKMEACKVCSYFTCLHLCSQYYNSVVSSSVNNNVSRIFNSKDCFSQVCLSISELGRMGRGHDKSYNIYKESGLSLPVPP